MTKTDLDEIAKVVRKIVREEVEAEGKDLEQNLGHQIRITKMELKNDMRDLDNRMKNGEIRSDNVSKDLGGLQRDVQSISASTADLQKDMKKVRKDVSYIRKTAELTVKNYDEGDVALGKRVTKIEEHLHIPSN